MNASSRVIAVVLVLGLAIGALAGAGAVLARATVSLPQRAADTAPTGQPAAEAPSSGAGTTSTVASGPAAGSGGASSGSAIAYPYPGTSGLAPDHTIVVTGLGQASLAADGSGRAAATKTATIAALADAKAQADLIASTLNVNITGVLSVSSTVSDYGPYYAVPMVEGSTPGAPVPAPSEGTVLPQLGVTVTVEYSIG